MIHITVSQIEIEFKIEMRTTQNDACRYGNR